MPAAPPLGPWLQLKRVHFYAPHRADMKSRCPVRSHPAPDLEPRRRGRLARRAGAPEKLLELFCVSVLGGGEGGGGGVQAVGGVLKRFGGRADLLQAPRCCRSQR